MTANTVPTCVDVTTLVHWGRPAVGIVRVEQQLCLWLLQQKLPDLHFVEYLPARGQFRLVSAPTLQTHLQRLDQTATSATGASAQPPAPNFEQRLRSRVLAWLGHLPLNWQTRLRAPLRHCIPLTHWGVAQARRGRTLLNRLAPSGNTAESPTSPPGAEHATFELPLGSIYISLGLDWNYKDMAQLYRIRQARQLRILLFCYDIIPIRLPHLCVSDVSRQFAHYFTDLAWCADLVLCISESSQRDLLSFLQTMSVPMPATAVIRLGADILPGQSQPPTPKPSPIQEPYILFVSTIERRKNHEILYRAYTRLAEEGLQLPKLLFVGMRGWGVNELFADLALDPRIQDRIQVLHNVSDIELASLYHHASFTVYPSLYEGWGLPVAESLAYGKYCLCSNAASLPEVGGPWVDYLDPWDLPAWVERLRYLITHPQEVAQRNAAIRASYRPHPWSQTAADIYHHAQQLLHAAPPHH